MDGWMVLHVPIFSTEHKLSQHDEPSHQVVSLAGVAESRLRFLPSLISGSHFACSSAHPCLGYSCIYVPLHL
uniref:Uncharacterized protein n=1 Tax=Setaria italica TaxID=4555 RepID=K3ZBH4_SETIT